MVLLLESSDDLLSCLDHSSLGFALTIFWRFAELSESLLSWFPSCDLLEGKFEFSDESMFMKKVFVWKRRNIFKWSTLWSIISTMHHCMYIIYSMIISMYKKNCLNSVVFNKETYVSEQIHKECTLSDFSMPLKFRLLREAQFWYLKAL